MDASRREKANNIKKQSFQMPLIDTKRRGEKNIVVGSTKVARRNYCDVEGISSASFIQRKFSEY